MPFKSFDEVFDPSLPLPLPGGGTVKIPEGDMEIGLFCVRLVTMAQAVHEGQELTEGDAPPQLRFEGAAESALQRRLLGEEAYALITERGGKATLELYTSTVVLWHAFGRETAEQYWNAGGQPVDFLPAANRAARRNRSKTSTSTAAAKKTPSQVSGTGTRSRKA
jgi:hypothetical protein